MRVWPDSIVSQNIYLKRYRYHYDAAHRQRTGARQNQRTLHGFLQRGWKDKPTPPPTKLPFKTPTPNFLIDVYIADAEDHADYKRRRQQMLDGRVLAVDHSHKLAKVIFQNRSRPFEAFYSVANEYGQIITW